MLRKILYANSFLPIVIIILIIIIIWPTSFNTNFQVSPPVVASPLYAYLISLVGHSPIIIILLSVIIVAIEAFLINHILIENELIPRNSTIAAFLFIILSGLFIDFINLNPVLIANLFIISAIWLFMRIYNLADAYPIILNIGTLIGIASLFYFPSIIFLILIWIGFIIYRIIKWREWIISIIGFIIPYIFLISYYFGVNQLNTRLEEYINCLQIINFNSFSPSPFAFVTGIIIGVLFLFSFLKLLLAINEKAIRIRKSTSFLIWYMLSSIILFLFSKNYALLGVFMILTPLSIIISIFVNNIKKTFWFEGILWVLTVLMISNHIGLWNLI